VNTCSPHSFHGGMWVLDLEEEEEEEEEEEFFNDDPGGSKYGYGKNVYHQMYHRRYHSKRCAEYKSRERIKIEKERKNGGEVC